MIDAILRDLRQPEYIHVLINPLPVYGLAMGLLGLIVAFFLRSRPAQIVDPDHCFDQRRVGLAGL